jgi:hypothetical protein
VLFQLPERCVTSFQSLEQTVTAVETVFKASNSPTNTGLLLTDWSFRTVLIVSEHVLWVTLFTGDVRSENKFGVDCFLFFSCHGPL